MKKYILAVALAVLAFSVMSAASAHPIHENGNDNLRIITMPKSSSFAPTPTITLREVCIDGIVYYASSVHGGYVLGSPKLQIHNIRKTYTAGDMVSTSVVPCYDIQ